MLHSSMRSLVRGWGPALFAALFAALLTAGALPGPSFAASGALDFRFKFAAGPAPQWVAATTISQADRDYIASLPELRVAMARSGTPPFERIAEDGQITGLQTDLLGHLAASLGLKVRPVVFGDNTAVLEAVRQGKADVVLTTNVAADRLQFMVYTLGTAPVPAAVVGRREGGAPALEHSRIAVERDSGSADIVRRRYPQATVVLVDSTDLALQAVATKTADVYVGGLLESLDRLSAQGVQRVEVQQVLPVTLSPYHLGLRKDFARLVPLLNAAIAAYRTAPETLAVTTQLASAAVPVGMALPRPVVLDVPQRQALAAQPLWRVGAVKGLDLLNSVDDQGRHTGIAADYTEQVSRRLGVATQTVAFDSTAAMLDALRLGTIDVAPFVSYTADRARDFGLSKPYLDMPYVLVGRTDGPWYWDLGSLRGKRLALAAQHPLLDEITRSHPTIQVVAAASGQEAMDLVASGGAEAAVEVKLFANQHINADFSGKLRALGEITDLPAQFRFATANDKRALLPLIDTALADIPALERERMARRWVAVDLVPPFPWRRYAPVAAVALAGLGLLIGLTVWWMRRLGEEVRVRRRAVEQLDDIGKAMPGVAFRYVLDHAGRLRRAFYSSGAQAFLGVLPKRNQTLIGSLAPHMPAALHQAAMQAQRVAFKAGEKFRHTCEYNHPAHGLRWLHTEAVPGTTSDGHVAWTGFVIDVTAERVLQAKVVQQAAQQAKDRHVMLASASHELRAPTHTLGLALESISDEGLPLPTLRALGVARSASRTLGQLLDDVLDSAKLDAGGVQLHPQDLDLWALLQEAADAHRSAARSKGLQFQFTRDEALPSHIFADGLRLKQVVTNLLSNAIKYTERGRVSLQVGAAQATDGRMAWVLRVSDTGPGIAPADQARLFEPFVTVPGAESAHAPSTGLGLSICRRLVTLMGGNIVINSDVGAGTSFTVRLPLHAASAASLARGSSVGRPAVVDAPAVVAPAAAAAGRAAAPPDGTLLETLTETLQDPAQQREADPFLDDVDGPAFDHAQPANRPAFGAAPAQAQTAARQPARPLPPPQPEEPVPQWAPATAARGHVVTPPPLPPAPGPNMARLSPNLAASLAASHAASQAASQAAARSQNSAARREAAASFDEPVDSRFAALDGPNASNATGGMANKPAIAQVYPAAAAGSSGSAGFAAASTPAFDAAPRRMPSPVSREGAVRPMPNRFLPAAPRNQSSGFGDLPAAPQAARAPAQDGRSGRMNAPAAARASGFGQTDFGASDFGARDLGGADFGGSGFGALDSRSGGTPTGRDRLPHPRVVQGRDDVREPTRDPVREVTRPQRTQVAVRSSGAVLMCDDDEVSRVFMAELLQRAGYAVVTAANARQALNIWQAGGVRAVITDLVMAGMDGMALVSALRQAEAGMADRTVIVVCSGSAPPPMSGPGPSTYDAFLPKPVQGQVLARTLARLLGPPGQPLAARA
jgi:two-component system, NarL family, sensor histidine kinase EvgS